MQRYFYAVVLAGSLLAQQKEPQFKDYPETVPPKFKHAPLKLRTPGQLRFKKVIREWVDRGVNFAGSYTLAEWGCGTGCVRMAVVNPRTGEVYDGPFGQLPYASFSLDPKLDVDTTGIFYHPDSRLFIARGCPNGKDCGAYFYEWTGKEFKKIR